MTSTVLGEMIVKVCQERGSALCVGDDQSSLNYEQVLESARLWAGRYLDRGVGPGKVVAIVAKNTPSVLTSLLGVWLAGGIASLINPTLTPGEIAFLKRRLGAACVVDDSMALEGELGSCSGLNDESSALILFTSGSTGLPLGVTLSHNNLLSNARACASRLMLGACDKTVQVLPLHYIYGLSVTLTHFICGGEVWLAPGGFVYPNMVLDMMEKRSATGFFGVASHYAILLAQSDIKERKLLALRYWAQAGDAMPEKMTREFRKIFPEKKIYLMYGQTETSPRLTCLSTEKVDIKPDSVGSPIEGVSLKIVDEAGGTCTARVEGEVCVQGHGVMLGYWHDETETRAVIRDGWLHTGDMGYLDEEGDLFLVGRRKRIAKIGGERVSLKEIEQAACALEGVLEAVVFLKKDSVLGERVILCVRGTEILKPEVLKNQLSKNLPFVKRPGEIYCFKEFPYRTSGKIDLEQLSASIANKSEKSG